jgi:membrane protein
MAWTDRLPRWLQSLLHTLDPLGRALRLWSDAGGMRMSAAVSFYGILSLAPLLLLLVGLLGWWVDRELLEKGLLHHLGAIMGPRGVAVIQEALSSARKPSEGWVASVAGFAVLLFGATGVFGELQSAFERMWMEGRGPMPRQTWAHTATMRLRGVGYVLVFGFLLLVSLVISALLNLFSGWAGDRIPLEALLRVLNEVGSFAVCAALFVGLMRLSGGPRPRTRFLIVGGFAGAILFTLGRQLLAAYLSSAAVVSAYGAAGSLIVLLMWIYFSSAVLLFGAGCARAVQELAEEGPQRGSSDLRWAPTSASADTTDATNSTAIPQR